MATLPDLPGQSSQCERLVFRLGAESLIAFGWLVYQSTNAGILPAFFMLVQEYD
jgi:hypothetical protein